MTFAELYQQAREKKVERPSPSTLFLREAAAVVKKTELAVRRWAMGETEPDALAKEALARHFGSTPEELFPRAADRPKTNND